MAAPAEAATGIRLFDEGAICIDSRKTKGTDEPDEGRRGARLFLLL